MKLNLRAWGWVLGLGWGWMASAAAAAPVPGSQVALNPDKVVPTDGRKTQHYLKDGIFVGGDHQVQEAVVRDIRRAPNAGFERVVIDLEGTRDGLPMGVPRPPYYQVAVTSDEQRVVLTVFGKPKLSFDAQKVLAHFKKSAWIPNIELLPRLNDDSWTFVIGLKPRQSVEVFELSKPARIILDIRNEPGASS